MSSVKDCVPEADEAEDKVDKDGDQSPEDPGLHGQVRAGPHTKCQLSYSCILYTYLNMKGNQLDKYGKKCMLVIFNELIELVDVVPGVHYDV